VPYDASDYVKATKLKVRDLIVDAFDGAVVYLADLDNIPAFGAGGTFCLEALGSAVDAGPGSFGQVAVTLCIWTYVETVDAAAAAEAVSALAQKLEAVLFAATRDAPGADDAWLATDFLQTSYMPREKGRAFRRKYLRAARTDWRVRLAACR